MTKHGQSGSNVVNPKGRLINKTHKKGTASVVVKKR